MKAKKQEQLLSAAPTKLPDPASPFMQYATYEEYKQAKYHAGERRATAEQAKYWEGLREANTIPIRKIFAPEEILPVLMARASILLKIEGAKEPNLVIDKFNEKVIEMLILYFTQNKEFEKIHPTFSLNKGIWLEGNVGCGKTFLLKLFSKRPDFSGSFSNKLFYKNIYSCIDLQETWKTEKKTNILASHSSQGNWFDSVYDDLGAEEKTVIRYGQKINFMATLLEKRYRLMTDQGAKTHITTNIRKSIEMKERYGLRVYDRMNSMFNRIGLAGNSRRK